MIILFTFQANITAAIVRHLKLRGPISIPLPVLHSPLVNADNDKG